MVLEPVVILEVVEGMMVVIPAANHNGRILLTIQVLQALESRSNPVGDDPLEMMC
jgi:hypothetical protein